uniref:Uncharacterized protein n=1 Tax=Strigamia maritima TaxID=126957 RepID=T1JEU0_STRMM
MSAKVPPKKPPIVPPLTTSATKIGKVEMARKARAKSLTGAMFDEEEPEEEMNKSYDEPVQLTDPELKEEITRVLTTENPNQIKNLIVFNYKEMAFQQISITDHTVHHIEIPSKVITPKPNESRRTSTNEPEEVGKPAPIKPAPNKFNYNDRAAQTYNLPVRKQEMQTLPPPRQVIIGNVSQGEIYDAYTAYAEQMAKVKGQRKEESSDSLADDLSKISLTIKIMERMVNQNIFDEIMQDFKYWEDKADEFRLPDGMLLPLWKFSHDDARGLTVTAVKWSLRYHDLFAATYGSVDYLKQQYGIICIHTLKNPAYPEFMASVDSGLLCVDINPQQPYLIAVGYYDGNVAVFDVKSGNKSPKFQCDPKEGKHQNPVWKVRVRWQENNLDGNLNFVSISSDGRVTNWVLFKSELRFADIVHLRTQTAPLEGPGGAQLDIKGAGTAIAFHRVNKSLFIVGTEEGQMFRCSKIYSNRFLQTYVAHSMAIHEISWNAYHPDIFLTCSADWTVKLWDYKINRPLFVFDLNSSVADVAWAPYAATVFAACTSDGKVFVFDLHVNKYKAVCEQIVVQKKGTALSSISFNQLHPIIVAGDSKGFTTCLKLSPNLRRAFKDNKTTDPEKFKELEMGKLLKILAIVRLSE